MKFTKFAEAIKSKRYIFHIHTNLTDGKSSLEDYYDNFKNYNLIFTEHIRKIPQYDYKDFLKKAHELGFLAGFEAKVLPGGFLDIPNDALEQADVIAVAVHSYKDNPNTLIDSLRKVFKSYLNMLPLVWVHPHTSKVELNDFQNKMDYVFEVMKGFEDKVYIEYNIRRKNFSPTQIQLIKDKGFKLIYGYDAHKVDDILK
jgi:histidinol phosphatase-like PHP family hydrolase